MYNWGIPSGLGVGETFEGRRISAETQMLNDINRDKEALGEKCLCEREQSTEVVCR